CGTQEFKKPGIQVPDEMQNNAAAESPESELVVSDTATVCAWCGRENAAGSVDCHECGSSLKRPKAKSEIQPIIAEPTPPRWQFRTLTEDEMKLDLVTLLTVEALSRLTSLSGNWEA